MSFDWNDFLIFARSLERDPLVPGPDEAAVRSAASRAYYAAFHLAIELAETEGFSRKRTGDDHVEIRRYYRNHQPTNKSRLKIAQELERLHNKRREADYHSQISSPHLATYAIGMAEQIIALLESL